MVDKKDVVYAAKLAKIRIDENEIDSTVRDIQNIMELADLLSDLDTDGIEPTYHIFNVENAFRDDIITNTDRREKLLQNAPFESGGCFTVPKVIE